MPPACPKEKSTLPSIQWSANGSDLIWRLLGHVQEKENFLVLFGKQDPKENTSGDNKIKVFERIASKLFPDEYQEHPKTLGKRVKGKVEDLCKIYKNKSLLLRQTGGGVGAPEDVGADGVHHYLDYYIPTEGPHHDTPEAAKNLWALITKDFPFFAELHKFLSTRPNVVPPVITTGTGPRGRQIDPLLLERAATPVSLRMEDPEDEPSSPSSRVVRSNNRTRTPQAKAPKPSTFGTDLTNAMDKARGMIKNIPKKRSLEERIMESSRENIKLARERATAQADHHRETLLIAQKTQVMDLFKAGIYTIEETRAKIAELDSPRVATTLTRTPQTPTPQTPRTPRTQHSATVTPNSHRSHRSSPRIRHVSPVWDIEVGKSLSDNDE